MSLLCTNAQKSIQQQQQLCQWSFLFLFFGGEFWQFGNKRN
jgi:hypothetical protein